MLEFMVTIQRIAVFGLGKVGALVAQLLARSGFDVIGIDQQPPTSLLHFKTQQCDVTNEQALHAIITSVDAAVCCLPYHLNIHIARMAAKQHIHYFDLTEDVKTTEEIRTLAKQSRAVMAPQCGLAPGFIGIVGADLASHFETIRSIELRVGALPQNPSGLLGYAFNWSAEGVVNEYLNDCEVIRSGEIKKVPPMQEKEVIVINGTSLEAYTTSGGLGTMCETYLHKVDELNYKTLRYPGHFKLMRFLLHELNLKQDRKLVGSILVNAKPPVSDDIVYVYAAAVGTGHHSPNSYSHLYRDEFVRSYLPLLIDGTEWRAISWTTAASICAVVEMVAHQTLPSQGFIQQEHIPLDKFLATQSGSLYLQQE